MKNFFIFFMVSLALSACGSGSDSNNTTINDDDNDLIVNASDNCPAVANPNQLDSNNNGIGDACESLNAEQQALNKISEFASSNGASSAPTIEDYKDIGLTGLSSQQYQSLNQHIAKLDKTDVDSIKEIQQVLTQVNIDPTLVPNNPDTPETPTNPKEPIEPETPSINADNDGDGVENDKDEYPDDANKAASVISAHRLLTQASYGATQDEIYRIVKIGTDAWINEQLNAPSAYQSDNDNHKTHLERTIEIASITEPDKDFYSENGIFNEKASNRVLKMQMSAWAENALGNTANTQHGNDQLRQRMAYALSQILVTSGLDGTLGVHGESLAYYYDLLSKHAFGNYRDLLGDISRSATMGVYLSHRANKKTNSALSTKPDENFARELIQLFVMGLYELNLDGSPNRDGDMNTYPDAGDVLVPSYTQLDVEELAKVMTGWDIKDNKVFGNPKVNKGNYASAMEFHPEFHEDESDIQNGDGNVDILGKLIPLNSGADGSGLDDVLDHLFYNSNVAPFISRRLISHFIMSNPSSDYVARISRVFNDNGNGEKGDLKAVLHAILSDEEARANDNNGNPNFGKLKEPLLAATQFFRAFNVTTLDGIEGPKDGKVKGASISGVYNFGDLKSVFGQAPLRAKSVFNFYDDSFVPSDDYFSNERLLSPETQLLTDQHIVDFNNFIFAFMFRFEKNKIVKLSKIPTTVEEFAATRGYLGNYAMLINFDRELKLFEEALEGDSNGDFLAINDAVATAEAVTALINHLDFLLLGNNMSTEFKQSLNEYLNEAKNINKNDNFAEAYNIIRDAVRFIVSSSAFLIQK